jgi:hypothetical protein
MIDVYHGRFLLRDEQKRLAGVAFNTRLYSWGWAAARMFQGDPNFHSMVIYVEFKNLADPATVVTNPTFSRHDGLEYYDGLAGSPDTDYLRLFAPTPTVAVIPGYSSYFPPGQGNMLVYKVVTGGAMGVHGRPFSAAANSKVYGAALAAAPDVDDRTQDVLISRGYYDPSAHLVKQPSGQIEITYKFPFE